MTASVRTAASGTRRDADASASDGADPLGSPRRLLIGGDDRIRTGEYRFCKPAP